MLLAVNSGVLAKTFADGIRKNYKDDALDAAARAHGRRSTRS